MSYPPYRNQNEGSYERDAERRRGRGDDEERDFRQRGEREGQRFRRDYAESFENEDRPFENRFGGRGERGQYEDWEQPRRYGSEGGRWGRGEQQSEWQQPSRRFGAARNEWQSQPQRSGRFGEGGGYFDEGSRYGESGRYERFGEGGFDESRRQRFGSESSDFGGERGSWGGLGRRSESGQFAGRGPKNYRRSDQRIQEEVCDRLTSDPQVDASEIQVSVKDGEITLEGTVGERRMKRLAEDCAESVAGVNQVHNRLRVEEEGAGRSQSQGREQGKEGQTSQSSTRQSSGRSSAI
jgi:osmotically-inducible protein OsmY